MRRSEQWADLCDSLLQAARRVPIVRRPPAETGPPFSICLGCGAEDAEDCAANCWVAELELAIARVEEITGP